MTFIVCDIDGCLSIGIYWCVWGCLDQHVWDNRLCLSCMISKKSKSVGGVLTCVCGLPISHFMYSSVGDNRHVVMEARYEG